MKRKKRSYLIVAAFAATDKLVKIIFGAALATVLLIELVLKNWEASNMFTYRLGDFFVKISYSIVASSIFFIINQQIPKIKKRIKTFTYVYNRVLELNILIDDFTRDLGLPDSETQLTEDLFKKFLLNLDPAKPVYLDNKYIKYNNWAEYLRDIYHQTNKVIQDLLPINDNLDTDLWGDLVSLQNALNDRLGEIQVLVNNWNNMPRHFLEIKLFNDRINQTLKEKYKVLQDFHHRNYLSRYR